MALEVGSRLGHYDVTALIGEGGMGQVYRVTRLAVVALLLFAAVVPAWSQGTEGPEAQARDALDAFRTAWNNGDNDALLRAVHFPFVTVSFNGQVVVAEKPADFTTEFAAMRAQEGWHHSFDQVEATWVSEDKVNFRVEWSRHHEDGRTDREGRIFYLVTKRDGHWGLQVRSPMR